MLSRSGVGGNGGLLFSQCLSIFPLDQTDRFLANESTQTQELVLFFVEFLQKVTCGLRVSKNVPHACLPNALAR